MSRDVVITGVGAVSALGVGARTLHERWSAGVVGIEDGMGAATEFEPKDHLSVKEVRRADRFTQFALIAGDEALAEAGWSDELPYEGDRIASILGTGIGGIGTLERGKELLIESGPKKVPPLSVPLMMSNAAAAAVSMRFQLLGPCHGIVSACSGGADAIGAAKMMIESGLVDAVVTGGSESAITPLSMAAFDALDALSVKGISRPFDEERDGFVMGEGAGILVLEAADKAAERGAKVLGTLRGYGASADANHLTAPDKTGGGPSRAMIAAMKDAGITPEDIVYINAHGTSTSLNDAAETAALKLGARRSRVQDPGLVAEVVDRAPARRRRRRGGGGDDPRPARPDRPADARAREPRRGPRPRLRPAFGQAAQHRRQAGDRAVVVVRLRRAQRRALPGGRLVLARGPPRRRAPASISGGMNPL